ncbi:uncharacterized protein [Apostichopus japonicus]|uniref:uncharacterized protein isoform X2 n=1 Tax=Stichopus japonicus TaxID=307972 RepID=UPI003AB659B6
MDALKRFRRKGKEIETGKTSGQADEQEASGFICPNCMASLPSPEQLHSHWEAEHNASNSEPIVAAVTGAAAMQSSSPSFNGTQSTDESQTQSPQNRPDLIALKQELEELKVSLKEEKWYTEELKKDLENHKSQRSNSVEVDNHKDELRKVEETKSLLTSEVVLLRQELADSKEKSKAYKQLKDAMEQKAAQQAGDLANLRAELDEEKSKKASFQETLQQTQLELRDRDSQVKALESQLLARPDGDDVVVLKKELVTIQTLMDEVTLASESEKQILQDNYNTEIANSSQLQQQIKDQQSAFNELQEKYERSPKPEEITRLETTVSTLNAREQFFQEQLQSLQDQNSKLQDQLSQNQNRFHEVQLQSQKLEQELAFSKDQHNHQTSGKDDLLTKLQQEVEKLRISKEDKEKELEICKKDLSDQKNKLDENQRYQEQNLTSIKAELTKMEGLLTESKSEISDLEKQLSDLQAHMKEEGSNLEETQSQVRDKQRQIQEQDRLLADRDSHIIELQASVQKHKADCDRLESERAELIVKIEAGEGTDTIIQQLKQENENLQSKVDDLQSMQEMKTTEHKACLDDLYKQLHDVTSQSEMQLTKLTRAETELTEVNVKLLSSQEKCARFDEELKAKVDLLSRQEATLAAQRADLESHLRTSKNALEDKQRDAERLQEHLQQTSNDLSEAQTKASSLEGEKQTLQDSLLSSQHDCALLKTDIKNKDNLLSTLEMSKTTQKAEFDGQIQRLQCELSTKSQEVKDLKDKFDTSFADLSHTQSLLDANKKLLEDTKLKHEEETNLRENTEKELNDCQSLLTKTVETLTGLEEEHEKMKHDHSVSLGSLQQKNSEREALYVAEKSRLQTEIHSISSEKYALEEKVKTLKADSVQLTAEFGTLNQQFQKEKDLVAEKNREGSELTQRVTDLESSKGQLEEQLKQEKTTSAALRHQHAEKDIKQAEQASKMKALEEAIQKKDDAQAEIQKKVEQLEQEVARQCEQCKNYELQVVKLQAGFSNEEEKCAALQQELEGLHNTLNNTESELERVRDSEASLIGSLDAVQQAKDELDRRVVELDGQQREAEKFLQDLKSQQMSLQDDLESQKQTCSELEEDKGRLISKLESEQQAHEREKRERAQDVSNLQETKQLLISQKLELQSQLSEKETDISKITAELEETKEVAKKVQNMLREETAALQNKVSTEMKARTEVERLKEEIEQRNNLQMSALNSNLSTLREELIQSENRSKELEANIDNLKGEIHGE